MPASETARLIASLELQDKFSRTADSASRKLGGLENTTGKVGKQMGVVGHALSTAVGVGLERAVTGGLSTFLGALKDGVVGAQELEAQQKQTEAAIKSTGGAAGIQASQVRDLAEKYEGLNATIDDKVIQSGENMLLTFTNINKKAFEPALQAALDMNTRFGGGEGGLQSTMVQLGKALNDPTKGMTALRRVGVAFSDEQQKRIKKLQEEGDLYGAQTLILKELNKEFGGSFLAQGDTSAAKAAKFTDSMDDLKISLAQGVLPGLDRVRDRLTSLFTDPKTVQGVKDFGSNIADFLSTENIDRGIDAVKGLFGFLKEVPWGTIAGGLKASAGATKAVVEAFLKLPPGVQTAIVGGLAVNKLSGGVLGNLAGKGIGAGVGEAVKFLFKRGDTPANPLFVAPVGGGLGGGVGGGVAGAAGAGRSIGSKAIGVLGGLTVAGIVAEIAKTIDDSDITKSVEKNIHDSLNLPTIDISQVSWPFGPKNTPTILPDLFGGNGLLGGTGTKPKEPLAAVAGTLGSKPLTVKDPILAGIEKRNASEYNRTITGKLERASTKVTRGIERHAASERSDFRTLHAIDRQVSSKTAQAVDRMRSVESASRETTGVLRRKNFSPKIDVEANFEARITVNSVTRRVVQMQRAAGRGFTSTGLIQ